MTPRDKPLPTEYRPLVSRAVAETEASAARSATGRALAAARGFELDLAGGTVTFDLPQGPVTLDAQVAGTVAPDGEFMWAWGHPSVPEPQQSAAWAVKRYAEAHQMAPLLDRKVPVTPRRAAEFAALVALMAGATGTYCGDYGSGQVWLAWTEGNTP
ncbi:MAG: DUF6882 domain-containing protein [Pseudomonadota bacterium]